MSYNSIIKTISIILISFLCFSCNQKELQNHNEAFFIDLIKDRIQDNDFYVHCVLDAKNPPPKLFTETIHIQELRDKALEQLLFSNFESADTMAITEYINRLKRPTKVGSDEFDLEKKIAEKAKSIKYNHTEESKSQKMAWIYSCLELEERILNLYSCLSQQGSGYGWTVFDAFSKKDSIKSGEKYEMVISPSFFHEEVIYHPNEFNISLNGRKSNVDFEFKQIGINCFLSLKPLSKGIYSIEVPYTRYTVRVGETIKGSVEHTFKVK